MFVLQLLQSQRARKGIVAGDLFSHAVQTERPLASDTKPKVQKAEHMNRVHAHVPRCCLDSLRLILASCFNLTIEKIYWACS